MWKFMETHSFRRISGDLPETLRKQRVSTKFLTPKLGEKTVPYAVLDATYG